MDPVAQALMQRGLWHGRRLCAGGQTASGALMPNDPNHLGIAMTEEQVTQDLEARHEPKDSNRFQ